MPLMLPAWATGPGANQSYVIPLEPGIGLPARVTTPPVRLTTTPRRLAWAAITSGRPPGLFPATFTLAGQDYRQWRIWSSLGLIEPDGNGGLRRTPDFTNLDPTEKGHLNYALAGTLLKAFAADQLETPWLAHLSLAGNAGYTMTRLDATREEPDYFGPTLANEFIVAEAKGRLRVKPALKLELDGKRQTRQITHVGSPAGHQAVVRRYGLAATANAQEIKIYVTDPPAKVEIPVSADEWIRAYYRMVIGVAEAINDGRPSQPGDQGGQEPTAQHEEGALRSPVWKPVRWEIPDVVRRWVDGEGSPLNEWGDEWFLSALGDESVNPDLTRLVDDDNGAA